MSFDKLSAAELLNAIANSNVLLVKLETGRVMMVTATILDPDTAQALAADLSRKAFTPPAKHHNGQKLII